VKFLSTGLLWLGIITNLSSASYAENVIFNVRIEAVYFTDATDIDGDGVDDVVISAQIDAFAQLGIRCCEVPASLVKDIEGVIPQVYLSNYGNPRFLELPSEASTHRTWAGAFFKIQGQQYYLHGRNGELGLPSENRGERSQIYRIEIKDGEVNFKLVVEFPSRTTTASVDVRNVGTSVEIIENNYNSFGSGAGVYRSHIYNFNANEVLIDVNPSFGLRTDIAHNEVRYSTILEGFVLTATEVWKNNSGTVTQTRNPASYYTSGDTKIDLIPVLYESNHAGFSVTEFLVEGKIIVLEMSSEFFGHQNGGYKGSSIAVYELNTETYELDLCLEDCILPRLNLPTLTQVYFKKIDLNFDGIDEVYVTGYRDGEIQIFHMDETELRQISSRRFELQDVGGWFGRAHLLRDEENACVFSISSIANFSTGTRTVPIRISSCRTRRL